MIKVLIALDFDPSAQKVAEEGYAIAKALSAEVTLVHVKAGAKYYASVGHVTVIGFTGHLKDDKPIPPEILNPDIISQEFLKKAMLHLGNGNIKILAVGGACAESLIKTAQNLKSDLIIMGSHSRRWFENTTMGSITERVLLNSNIPVLVIPTNKSH